jgi:hypothetical protein
MAAVVIELSFPAGMAGMVPTCSEEKIVCIVRQPLGVSQQCQTLFSCRAHRFKRSGRSEGESSAAGACPWSGGGWSMKASRFRSRMRQKRPMREALSRPALIQL